MPKTVKGAQSEPNYVSRLLIDCVSVFHKIVTPVCRAGGKNYSYATVLQAIKRKILIAMHRLIDVISMR